MPLICQCKILPFFSSCLKNPSMLRDFQYIWKATGWCLRTFEILVNFAVFVVLLMPVTCLVTVRCRFNLFCGRLFSFVFLFRFSFAQSETFSRFANTSVNSSICLEPSVTTVILFGQAGCLLSIFYQTCSILRESFNDSFSKRFKIENKGGS